MNVLIYGKRKQGKSTLALALAVTRSNRVMIFDPNNQFPIVESIALSDLPEWLKESRELAQRDFVIARVGPFNTEDINEAFRQFAGVLYDEHGISVIVDEAHMLQGANWMHDDLDRWNRRSSASVVVIQTTHRVVDAHPDSRYHADHVFFFYAYLEKELKSIRENFGRDVAEEIPKLQAHQVIDWTKQAGGRPVWYLWPDGSEWFIDLENENDN